MKDNVIGIIIYKNKIWGYLIGMVTTYNDCDHN